ncbi:hypothetical protein DZF91_10675 [Actinomadura logoneensis]|uniref:Tn3 transposase DDE domain-containing protein n=1 Tax=Actinomadura logoneensis TaxID=2293572 RepID=A0A372JNN0_9ACTN|nr:hypothetical protein DZF91_10675 [Actinomadura logoneensis]
MAHVDQNHARSETHAAAKAILVQAQREVPIVNHWGGGAAGLCRPDGPSGGSGWVLLLLTWAPRQRSTVNPFIPRWRGLVTT